MLTGTLQVFLFTFNFLLFGCGGMLLGYSIYFFVETHFWNYIGVTKLIWGALVTGVALLFMSVIGCSGAVKMQRRFLVPYGVLVLGFAVMACILGVYISDIHASFTVMHEQKSMSATLHGDKIKDQVADLAKHIRNDFLSLWAGNECYGSACEKKNADGAMSSDLACAGNYEDGKYVGLYFSEIKCKNKEAAETLTDMTKAFKQAPEGDFEADKKLITCFDDIQNVIEEESAKLMSATSETPFWGSKPVKDFASMAWCRLEGVVISKGESWMHHIEVGVWITFSVSLLACLGTLYLMCVGRGRTD